VSLAELGERAGMTFCLENLNTVIDHPGAPFARAQDTLALVEAVNRPGLRMMLDLYHAQIGEGNLIAMLRRADSLIGEVQVADVPGRCEPGTGEINYSAIGGHSRKWATAARSDWRHTLPATTKSHLSGSLRCSARAQQQPLGGRKPELFPV